MLDNINNYFFKINEDFKCVNRVKKSGMNTHKYVRTCINIIFVYEWMEGTTCSNCIFVHAQTL